MADEAAHPPGTPTWVDLSTSDVDAGRRFYEQLFGWTTDEPAGPEFGGYAMFRQGDKVVAGSGPVMEGAPPAWTTYVRTADAAATAQKARDAGGEVVVEPMEIPGAGSMAVLKDPTGAYFGVWQNGEHKGAELFNAPVSLAWNELGTRDVEAAKRFYSAVFGWIPKGADYVQWELNGKSIGGCIDLGTVGVPAEVPANWLPYFTVGSVDETAQRVQELGGTVSKPPSDIPDMGRFAVVADPQGAVFAIFSS
ncbi:MAG: VOC family protein [Candidatus Dormibacteraeota bacterium]|nr:VOC family protein [Candidatus Dormibacteraeota bacterium]